MFGVGENPVYLARLAERNERKEASGEAEREREDQRRAELIGNLFDGADDGTVDAASEVAAAPAGGAEAVLTAPPMPSPLVDDELTAAPESTPAQEPNSDASSVAFDVLFAEPTPVWEDNE